MRTWTLLTLCGASLLLVRSVAAESWDFQDAKVGELPKGWTAAKTGAGLGSVWKVQEDATAPAGLKVLAQTSAEGPIALFNLCFNTGSKLGDVDLKLSLKAVAGKIDQGGGPLWRCQDRDNYYVARLNPLEGDFRLFHVVQGKRTLLGKPVQVSAAAGAWHTIRVTHVGQHITCYLNDKQLIEMDDGALREPGMIGLWTKADAVTSFVGVSAVAPKK
jgi:3-keto-disaccharide hydrolase